MNNTGINLQTPSFTTLTSDSNYRTTPATQTLVIDSLGSSIISSLQKAEPPRESRHFTLADDRFSTDNLDLWNDYKNKYWNYFRTIDDQGKIVSFLNQILTSENVNAEFLKNLKENTDEQLKPLADEIIRKTENNDNSIIKITNQFLLNLTVEEDALAIEDVIDSYPEETVIFHEILKRKINNKDALIMCLREFNPEISDLSYVFLKKISLIERDAKSDENIIQNYAEYCMRYAKQSEENTLICNEQNTAYNSDEELEEFQAFYAKASRTTPNDTTTYYYQKPDNNEMRTILKIPKAPDQ